MSITVLGVDKLLAQFAAKSVAADVAAQSGKDVLGEQVLHEAQSLVPVLTGTLRDSLTYDRGFGEVGRVYTDVVYAGEVEFGGLHNPPEPYMRPAADLADGEASAVVMKGIIDSA